MPRPEKLRSKRLSSYKLEVDEFNQITKDIKKYGLKVKRQFEYLNKNRERMPLARMIRETMDKIYEDSVTSEGI